MKAKIVALRLLSIKGRTVQELKKKLSLKSFPPEEIEEALQTCIRLGYLDDAQEGQRRTERLKKRGYGPRYIAAKMRHEGLKASSISASEQKAMILDLLKKPAWQKKERAKLMGALQRRGFDMQSILELLATLPSGPNPRF